MKKAILEFAVPESCEECKLFDVNLSSENAYCWALNAEITGHYGYYGLRDMNCPLKIVEVPDDRN